MTSNLPAQTLTVQQLIPEQIQKRLSKCLADPTCKVAYWCSDQWGGPANHECENYGAEWQAYPGRVDDIGGNPKPCSNSGLHATDYPHQWKGARVWIVALWNWVQSDNKYAATKREIILEVTPNTCISQSVAARLGLSANLDGASLYRASLVGARLDGASLYRASLVGASLDGAVFKNCTGLTAEQRKDMAARGAIFIDEATNDQ